MLTHQVYTSSLAAYSFVTVLYEFGESAVFPAMWADLLICGLRIFLAGEWPHPGGPYDWSFL